MHMIWHDDVAEDIEVIPAAHSFEGVFEEASRCWRTEMWLFSVTTEGDEMEVSGVLVADEALGHFGIVSPVSMEYDNRSEN
jgi:hypothetical protein